MKATLEEKTRVREEAKVGLGLCSTCSNLGECKYPRSLSCPVMHCDEFCGYEMKGLMFTDKDLIPKSKTAPSVTTSPISSKFKGLCMNCDNSIGCTYPKSEAGVWHCEEYK